MGVHDGVFLQGVNPQDIAQAARGKTAAAQLAGLNSSPAMVKALRDYKTPYAQMQGKGLAATAPTLAETLGGIALRDRGDKGMSAIEQQAKALRGDTEQGNIAASNAALGQAAHKEGVIQDAAATKAGALVQAATTKNENTKKAALVQAAHQAGQAKIKAEALKGQQDRVQENVEGKRDMEMYIGPNGLELLQEGTQEGTLFKDGKQIMDTTGYRIAPEEIKNITGAGYGNKDIDKRATDAVLKLHTGHDLYKHGTNLSDEDKRLLNDDFSRILDTTASAFIPSKMSPYLKKELSGYSEEGLQFLSKISKLSSVQRHELFGAALTAREEMSASEFATYMAGMDLDTILSQLDTSMSDARREITTIDGIGGSDNFRRVSENTLGIWDNPQRKYKQGSPEAQIQEADAEVARLQAIVDAENAAGG